MKAATFSALGIQGELLEDSLFYGVSFDSQASTAIAVFEFDAEFHKPFLRSIGLQLDRTAMVDFVFRGVTKLALGDLPERPAEWEVDEKPHHYEVAVLRVRNRGVLTRRGPTQYCFRFQLGQSFEIEFKELEFRVSSRQAGVVHQYG